MLHDRPEQASEHQVMSRQERDILECAAQSMTKQGVKADDLVDEAIATRHGRSDKLVVHAKMLRLELLKVKADLERGLGRWSLNCKSCGRNIHWVPGLGVRAGHWAHAEPAPHGEPVVENVGDRAM